MPARSHGQSGTPVYAVWKTMIGRCLNPNNKDYAEYGGRGITVCERWRRFEAFTADVGPRPSSRHSIERIDNDGSYSPDNCRWATATEQGRNKRNNRLLAVRGRVLPMSEWAERMGMNYFTLRQRLRYGWSPEDAVTRPVRKIPQREG